jgi:hypothetical protein
MVITSTWDSFCAVELEAMLRRVESELHRRKRTHAGKS